MVVLRFLWKLVGVGVTIQYGYWAVMSAGAFFHLNDVPIVSPDWMALGFFTAALMQLSYTFPSLWKTLTQ